MNIFVGNLHFDLTSDELRAHFEQCGAVTAATVVKNRSTGRSRGFGFVDMPNAQQARTALRHLNDSELLGRRMRCHPAQNQERREPSSYRGRHV